MKEKTIALKMPKDSQEAKLFGQLCMTTSNMLHYLCLNIFFRRSNISSASSIFYHVSFSHGEFVRDRMIEVVLVIDKEQSRIMEFRA